MSLPHLPTPAGTIVEPHPALDALIGVMARLRAPGGCAWDAEQTHESLTKYLIEEAHELVDAIEHGTRDDIIEELGDVLYQVLFHADIATADAESPFTIEDVAARSLRKMVGRHPHVFGDVVADTADEVSANWETWKAREKPARTSVLDGLPRGLPALARASAVLAKSAALSLPSRPSTDSIETMIDDEDALGDELLRLVEVARARGWDAERALRHAVRAREDEVRTAESASA
jgi:XTP/dITP diphosphohydrolase